MNAARPWSLLALCLAGSLVAAPPSGGVLDEAHLAARIDEHLASALKKRDVPAASEIDDAAFLRRAYLDLAGRIPNILEVRDYLDDDRPDRRGRLVDSLLKGLKRRHGGDSYSDHWSWVWRSWMLPLDGKDETPALAAQLESWLREQLAKNAPFDQIARELIESTDQSRGGQPASVLAQALQYQPENLAAATARLFLGLKLECAQCHDDRSGGSWSREQFWELAALFSPDGKSIGIPSTKRTVQARFPDGKKPVWKNQPNPRKLVADWTTGPNNPWFAKSAVNRIWAHLFGAGLIDPVDEAGNHNPPSHPELLDELAGQFVAHKYDLKYLLRALMQTKLYRSGSITTDPGQDDPRLFARMPVRGLGPSQLFDSLAEVMEYQEGSNRANALPVSGDANPTPRAEFMARFSTPERPTEQQRSILQALFLMNGSFPARASSLEHNRALATIAESRVETERKVETLYLMVLTRTARAEEMKRLVPYVDKGGPSGDKRKALADVLWALLNSAEFQLNH